jgi:hypothetical protein
MCACTICAHCILSTGKREILLLLAWASHSALVRLPRRGVFMWNAGTTLIVIAGFLWGAPWRQREALRVLRAIQRTALVMGLGIITLLTVFPNEVGSRLAIYSETLLLDSPTSELIHRTHEYLLKQLGYAFDHPRWPYGYGTGRCTLVRME